jgi:hypothetical protein
VSDGEWNRAIDAAVAICAAYEARNFETYKRQIEEAKADKKIPEYVRALTVMHVDAAKNLRVEIGKLRTP